ncbi:MAG: hypothetical protein GKR89_34820 [Candidatus Latescibacteria bacterium]|nr:hypothetical protein [Candidatus Latescibacterota bacterium]
MSQLALYCERTGDTADTIAVYGEYCSSSNHTHLLAYFGGQLYPDQWCSERIVVERTSSHSTALVTEMGDWNAGRSFVCYSGRSRYERTETSTIGQIDTKVEDRVYELVNHWVYWDTGKLRLRLDNVDVKFSDRIATVGEVDRATLSELRAIWVLSAQKIE